MRGVMEQEVSVVQMATAAPLVLDLRTVPAATKHTEIWASLETGEFDTRPLLANHVSRDAERILAHGGVFIIVCAPENDSQLVYSGNSIYGGVQHEPLTWFVYDMVPDVSASGSTLTRVRRSARSKTPATSTCSPHS
jgi:hypothetical protein